MRDVPQDPISIDPDRPHGITGDPREVVEQPDLSFERVDEARWTGDVVGMRLAAVMLVRRKRRRAGHPVTPTPWIAIVATTSLAMVLVTATWGLLRLAGRRRPRTRRTGRRSCEGAAPRRCVRPGRTP